MPEYIEREAPAVDVAEVKHGKWVEIERVIEGEKHIYKACSLCGASQVAGLGLAKYCYECGSKMDGKTEAALSNGLVKADELANGSTNDEIITAWNEELHLANYVNDDYRNGVKVSLIEKTVKALEKQQAEIERLQKKLALADECIADVEDALYRGSDNDWASEAVDAYKRNVGGQ